MISQSSRPSAHAAFFIPLGFTLLLSGCSGGGSESSNTAANAAPVISASANVSVAESATEVMTISASDADGDALSFSLSGSVDDSLFTIDASTGALSFNNAPDFEAPGDSDGDNTYDIEVSADDGTETVSQSVAVSVTDVDEAPSFTSGATVSVA